jgi:hypothetical protein
MKALETSVLTRAAVRGLVVGGDAQLVHKQRFSTGLLKTLVIITLLAYPVCGGFTQEAGQQNGWPLLLQKEKQQPARSQQPIQEQPPSTRAYIVPLIWSASGIPEDAKFVIDVNPLMWILAIFPDENDNTAIFFDVGLQFNLSPSIAIRLNPSFSFGLNSETVSLNSDLVFVEAELPIGFICFPFSRRYYLEPIFFGLYIVNSYHYTGEDDDTDSSLVVSVGTIFEAGYQLKLSNHLSITPAVGIKMPNPTIHSPWPKNPMIAPNIRISIGFWL